MRNQAARYGLMFGAALVAIKLLMYLINPRLLFQYGPTFLVGISVPLVFMYLSVKSTREEQEGMISFGEAVKASFLTYTLGTLISVFFQFILFNFVDSTLIELSHEVAMDTVSGMMESLGGQEEMLEEIESQLEEVPKTFTFGQAMLQFMTYLIIPGIIYSLIMSAIMKNNK